MDNVTEFPTQSEEEWLFQYHEPCRVVIEGRLIPRLKGVREGDHTSLIVDGRLSISVPNAYAQRVAWLLANALAIGAGYSHLGAETRERPFAPRSMALGGDA